MTGLDIAHDGLLVLAVLGLAFCVGRAGIPLLCQGAFVGIGAFTTLLLADRGVPLVLAAVAAVGLSAAVGYLVGGLVAGLDRPLVALATWGIAAFVYTLYLAVPGTFGGEQGLTSSEVTPATSGATVPVVIVLVALLVGTLVLRRADAGVAGLDGAALRAEPGRMHGLGVPVEARRASVVLTAAAVGGSAGAGLALLEGTAAAADYSPTLSVQLFVAAVIGGRSRVWGPVLAGVCVVGIPRALVALDAGTVLDLQRAHGAVEAAALAVMLLGRAAIRTQTRMRPATSSDEVHTEARAEPEASRSRRVAHQGTPPERGAGLRADAVGFAVGGRTILEDVSLYLRAGEVLAVVGPNGSGKSTIVRVLGGAVAAVDGTVAVQGLGPDTRPLARRPPQVVRTTQLTRPVVGITVARQLELAARTGRPARLAVLTDLLRTRRAREDSDRRAVAVRGVLDRIGMAPLAGHRTETLAPGSRRLLDVACAFATGAPFVLLDEPAAGLDDTQLARLAVMVEHAASGGTGVLLVEHNLGLVRRLATSVTVLEGGRVIHSGPTEDVLTGLGGPAGVAEGR